VCAAAFSHIIPLHDRKWWETANILLDDDGKRNARARSKRRGKGKARRRRPEPKIAPILDDDGAVLFPRPSSKLKGHGGERDALDYSVWDTWVPDDPVSMGEMREKKEAVEKARDAEFEKNNAEFCDQFKDDMKKREEGRKKKAATALQQKLKGNRYYKKKDYAAARVCYHKALKQEPFNTAVLVNLAQAHAREGDHPGVEEFCTRAIFVDAAGPQAVKALFRRAASRRALGRLADAVEDLRDAAELDDANADVAAQLAKDERALEDARVEQDVAEKVGAIRAAKSAGAGGAPAGEGAAPVAAHAAAAPGSPPAPAAGAKRGKAARDAQSAAAANAYEKMQAAMSDTTGLTIMADVVDVLLGKKAAAAPDGASGGDAGAPAASADFERMRFEAALQALPELLDAPEARVHLRVSGVLSLLCEHACGALQNAGSGGNGGGGGGTTSFAPQDTPLVLAAIARASETLRANTFALTTTK